MTQKEPLQVIYSRISKENEKLQDIYVQEKKLIEKFKLVDPIILREKGTAYKMDQFKKRKEFIRFLRYAFLSEKTTIDDLFLNNYERKKISLYVWDSHRLMRNMMYSFIFLLLCDLFDVEIHTYKDGKLKENEKETPSKKLLRYVFYIIHSYSGEEYSYTTSENIKKAFVKRSGITFSKERGIKLGTAYTNTQGEKVNFTLQQVVDFNNKIIKMHRYYLKRGQKGYYKKIIEKLKKEDNIVISMPYISRLKGKPYFKIEDASKRETRKSKEGQA